MSLRRIRENYGKHLKSWQAYDAAIRAELSGGNDVLDAHASIRNAAAALKEKGDSGSEKLYEALQLVDDVASVMREEIRRRYR